MENKMKELAQLIGLELEEEFRMDNRPVKYKLTKDGLMYWTDAYQQWNYTCGVEILFTGEKQIVKIPKPILNILTEEEKEYLSSVIKPFRDRIVWIKKIDSPIQNYEYIKICYQDHNYTIVLNFPDFKVGTMYKGMELCKDYTLEELGL